ncbi:Hypothetical protein A7982_10675 [Minicystis rosea]|nr:Hypothetical protein A7982_10675 [Minicystis rosea]
MTPNGVTMRARTETMNLVCCRDGLSGPGAAMMAGATAPRRTMFDARET